MKVISKTENSDIATVYIARNPQGKMVEFVESVQPPLTIGEKWVIIVSTLFGCPVDCSFCDAGGKYGGKLSAEEILFQIDYPVKLRFPDGIINTQKFKVQFSRMGEPSFNMAVLEALERLPLLYTFREFVPSLSTIAPQGTSRFFYRLLEIKQSLYPTLFQLQFSIHSTSESQRNNWIPVKKWSFDQIADFGKDFFSAGGKKITLNFAVSKDSVIDPKILSRYFTPENFIIKLTPVNPTFKAQANKIEPLNAGEIEHIHELRSGMMYHGYEVIVSFGEWEENKIGSNCGQYVQAFLQACKKLPHAYSYKVE